MLYRLQCVYAEYMFTVILPLFLIGIPEEKMQFREKFHTVIWFLWGYTYSMLPREQQEHIRKAFAILVKGLEVAIRLIESDLFDLSSTRSKDQRCVLNVLQHHGSQHMASMSPLLVCLLRQAMWCCEPMRSTGGPTHEGNCLYVTMIKRLSSNK